jgi:mRNA interferase HicA
MKRESLLRHLRLHGCYLKREGGAHSLWFNPNTGQMEAVPRHSEVADILVRKICRGLSVPEAGKSGSKPE